MATLRGVPRSSVASIVSAFIIASAISFAAVHIVRGVPADATYYACLYAGSLSQVSTTPPANCGRGESISWNSQGVPGADASALLFRERRFVGSFSASSNLTAGHSCPDDHRIISGGLEISNPDNATTTMSYLNFDAEQFRFGVTFTGTADIHTTIVCLADAVE